MNGRLIPAAAMVLALVSTAPAAAADGAWAMRVVGSGADGKLGGAAYHRRRLEASDLFRAEKYDEAAAILRELVGAFPADGNAWYDLGWSLYRAGRYGEAADAYSNVVAFGFETRSRALYNLACMQSLAGRKEAALASLEASLADHLEIRGSLETDADFDALRDDPRFAELAGKVPLDGFDRVAGWRADLDFLADEIARLHWTMFHGGDMASVRERLRGLSDRVAELDDASMAMQIQQVLCGLGDGHTSLYPIPTPQVPFTYLPLVYGWFADGLYVVGTDADHADLVGAELLDIGGLAAGTLAEKLEPYVSRDNPMGILWLGPLYLRLPAVLRDMGAHPEDGGMVHRLRLPDGRERDVRLVGGPGHALHNSLPPCATLAAADQPRWMRRVDANYWSEIVDGVLYVQYNRVVQGEDETIAGFASRLRGTIDQNGPRALVLDLRHNNGGNSFLNRPLLKALIHFENTRPGAPLLVIMGRQTFSAAMNFLSEIDYFTDALLVGEPSGSAANFVGESTEIALPWSGLQMSISSRYHQSSYPTDDRKWLVPDLPVPSISADYFAGRDPAWEAAQEFLAHEDRHPAGKESR